MKNSLSASTHGVLHVLMSKAALEGRELGATVKIPLIEAMQENGSKKNLEEAEGILLKIEIKTSFEKGYGDSLTVEVEEDEEETL